MRTDNPLPKPEVAGNALVEAIQSESDSAKVPKSDRPQSEEVPQPSPTCSPVAASFWWEVSGVRCRTPVCDNAQQFAEVSGVKDASATAEPSSKFSNGRTTFDNAKSNLLSGGGILLVKSIK